MSEIISAVISVIIMGSGLSIFLHMVFFNASFITSVIWFINQVLTALGIF